MWYTAAVCHPLLGPEDAEDHLDVASVHKPLQSGETGPWWAGNKYE